MAGVLATTCWQGAGRLASEASYAVYSTALAGFLHGIPSFFSRLRVFCPRRPAPLGKPVNPILPVIDLQRGRVVRGIAGQRAKYRPVESQWAKDATCLAIGTGLRDRFGFKDVYVADLDAIEGRPANLEQVRVLRELGLRVLLDAGIGDREQWARLREQLGDAKVEWIVGLESLRSESELKHLADADEAPLWFSLDLQEGRPLTRLDSLRRRSPIEIAEAVIDAGLGRLIVLDLAAVGVGEGPRVTSLCHSLRERHPASRILAGGGVRTWADIQLLREAGCEQVLVASALHNGTITANHVREHG